jgi:hypothetical protein
MNSRVKMTGQQQQTNRRILGRDTCAIPTRNEARARYRGSIERAAFSPILRQ